MRTVREVALDRTATVGAVESRFTRWRIANPVVAGPVVVSPLQHLSAGRGFIFLRRRTARLDVKLCLVGAGRAGRANQHDGLYASAVESVADHRGADADRGIDDAVLAFARLDVADGRSRASIICDGGGAARGARSR